MADVLLTSLIKPSSTFIGDVTGSGTDSIYLSITNKAVTLAKMADLAANSILGNNTGSAATPIALTVAQVKTMLNLTGTNSGDQFTSIPTSTILGRTTAGTGGAEVLTGAQAAAIIGLSNYAPLASPTFTGTPAAPTAAAGTNTTQLATTAFVQTAVRPNRGATASSDLDDASINWIAFNGDNLAGAQSSGFSNYLMSTHMGGNYVSSGFAFPHAGTEVYFGFASGASATYTARTWTWRKLWHEGNFTPTNYAPIASPSFTGNVTVGNGNHSIAGAVSFNSGTVTINNASGSEGGEIIFAKPASGTALTSNTTVDVNGNSFRIFAGNASATGYGGIQFDLTANGIMNAYHSGNLSFGSGLTYSGGVLSATAGGGGTVTSVSVVTANGISGTVATSTTTPAITLSLGAITPTSVTAAGNIRSTAGGHFYAQAGASDNAHFWLQNEAGVNQGLLYWDRAADTIVLRRYNAAGNGVEGQITISGTEIQISHNINAVGGLTCWGSGRNIKLYDNNGTTANLDIGSGYNNATDGNAFLANRWANGFIELFAHNGGHRLRVGGTSHGLTYNDLEVHRQGANVNIQAANKLTFGSQTRQMIDLWSTSYGIGVQNNTLYLRSGSGYSFFKGGTHTDSEQQAGSGGVALAHLDTNGNFLAAGRGQFFGRVFAVDSGAANPGNPAGSSIQMYYMSGPAGDHGALVAYNYSTAAYKPIVMEALSWGFRFSGSTSTAITFDTNGIHNNPGGWFRSYSNSGWYNQTHGGGIWMDDSNYVKIYNKPLWTSGFRIESTAPTIEFYDTDQGTSTWIHCNSNQIGFLANNAYAWCAYRDASNNWGCTGNVYGGASDARLKTNIRYYDAPQAQMVDDAFDKITLALFDWNETGNELGFTDKNVLGAIAQEMQVAWPSAVIVNSTLNPINGEAHDYLTIMWDKTIPLVIGKVKNHEMIIKDLQRRVAELEAQLL